MSEFKEFSPKLEVLLVEDPLLGRQIISVIGDRLLEYPDGEAILKLLATNAELQGEVIAVIWENTVGNGPKAKRFQKMLKAQASSKESPLVKKIRKVRQARKYGMIEE